MEDCFSVGGGDGCFRLLSPKTGCFSLENTIDASSEDDIIEPDVELDDVPEYFSAVHCNGTDIFLGRSSYDYVLKKYIGIVWRYVQDIDQDYKLYYRKEQRGEFALSDWAANYSIMSFSGVDNMTPFANFYAGSAFGGYGELRGTWVDPVILDNATMSPGVIADGNEELDMEAGAERGHFSAGSAPVQRDTPLSWYLESENSLYDCGMTLFEGSPYQVYGGAVETRYHGTYRGYWHKKDGEWYFDTDVFTLFNKVQAEYPPQYHRIDFSDRYVEDAMFLWHMTNSDKVTCNYAIGVLTSPPYSKNNGTQAVIVKGARWDNTTSLVFTTDSRHSSDGIEYFVNGIVKSGSYWMIDNYALIDGLEVAAPGFGKTWYNNDDFIVFSGSVTVTGGELLNGWFVIELKGGVSGHGVKKLKWRDITDDVAQAVAEAKTAGDMTGVGGGLTDASLLGNRLLLVVASGDRSKNSILAEVKL